MTSELEALGEHVAIATGSDRELDRELDRVLTGDASTTPPDYTASVDRCIDLVHLVLPGWAWHVGWDASGILPYATLCRGRQRVEARAPTVPLALLRALVRARKELARHER
ncbi:hypothetical protein [Benzoatithermus flavus]|uniref:Uncharacterized protein n=1 Tax=Benzoatithermus flavus TaxID=3108223 RepID=A0ABU8XVK3_9PROT